MAEEFYKQANDAFFEDDYDEALELYNKAINLDATNPEYFLKRSATYQKMKKKGKESLTDAEKALSLIESNEQNEQSEKTLIKAKALLRKGIALFELKDYHEAKNSLETSKELNPNEKSLATWLKKTEAELEKIPKPTPTSPDSAGFLPQSRVRHEWYQNENFVIISIFIKNVKKETVDVYMTEKSLSVTVKLPTGSDYSLELDPLAHEIAPKESKYDVLSTKIEVKIKKANPGVKWGVLEGDDAIVGSISYPSSAKHAKNWDALAKEISKEQDKPEGEAALNALFQQLYKDADDDTKRAMLKSYTESSGTCLSTNWNEVSKGKVETKPPEGMVAKKVKLARFKNHFSFPKKKSCI
ncbi:SGS domain-containing protein [Glomus cerebriforme]|uniref:SGS domain-containing protein n=1 Tax=Glomus cerebriforme TaxID=658196 RepID=A0A397SFK1_9GLOM|nr:SGS domain-containing protein [Glomus cerebriforme]